MNEVVLKNIVKSYDGKKNVIDNISFDIKENEFIVLVGSSGCGKSTILRLISGLENITSGEIYIGDKLVNNVPPKDRDIAFVFQSYALYPHLDVYENIAFGLKMRKYDKALIDEKVKSVVKTLELEPFLHKKPRELSGGQRQRVALGRAIVREPKVFLMDEPLSNLDANLRVQMRSEIKRLHKKLNATFVYVTHDQTEALTMGDRIVVLNNGVIQQADTPERIYNVPKNKFVAGFIGQMNFIDIKLENQGFYIENTFIKLDDDLYNILKEKENLCIGIRAEKMVSGNNQIRAKIDIDEMCGAEKNVYVSLNNSKCVAKIPLSYKIDTDILLNVSVEDMFFFDNTTGENLFYK